MSNPKEKEPEQTKTGSWPEVRSIDEDDDSEEESEEESEEDRASPEDRLEE